jgi:putative glutamine amidotransferase
MCTISKKPMIGITTWRRDLPTFLGEKTDLYTLDPAYIKVIEQAGGVPVLFSHSTENVSDLLDIVDGLLITGGGDVDPVSYGELNKGKSYDVNAEADIFEIALIREAAKRQIPTIGICRGFQILQVAFGGSLYQDLHHDYPEHPKNTGGPDYILGQRHGVVFEEQSTVARVYKSRQRVVNTIHHQCIKMMGSGFKPVGWSEDGIVEAAESTDSWFALGVQWHPEKLNDETEQELFRYFVQQCN